MTHSRNNPSRRSLLGGISALSFIVLSGCGGAGGAGSSAQPQVPPLAPPPPPPPISPPPPPPPPPPTAVAQIRGFNQNWAQMPALSTGNMIPLMKRLKPGMIRYPGGTVTHSWDWKQGRILTRAGSAVHPIAEVKELSDALGAQVVVVLDILNSSLDDQMAMLRELRRLGVAFRHVELGNEIYAQDAEYAARFPTGADYGAEANRWAAAVKAEFLNVQVAALLFAREVGGANVRGQNWNADVLGGPTGSIDAWTFHIYIPLGGTAASVMDNYRSVSGALPLGGKPIWITEYGNKNETSADYIPELLALADAVQAQNNVTIALNHQMIGGEKNKMPLDALALNAEGEAFVKRVGG
jgi:hypothetical protein